MRALYAFSGDPITYGHIDVVSRAAKHADIVHVGIGSNPGKKYTFTLDERLAMAKRALAHVSNVSVGSFEGLLVDYAYEQNFPLVIRGVRNVQDFEFEETLHFAGGSQKRNIETMVMFPRPELAHISSSAAKAIHKEHGYVQEFVPIHVKYMMDTKLKEQFYVGVTGSIGVGKSHVCTELVAEGRKRNIPVHNIDLDAIGHSILHERMEPAYASLRQEIGRVFPGSVDENGVVQRKVLGSYVFADANKRAQLDALLRTPISVRLGKEVYGKKGILLFNAALITEANFLSFCNNTVVLVDVPKDVQYQRLAKRNLTNEQIARRIESQFSTAKKAELISAQIANDNFGKLISHENLDGTKVDKLFDGICETVGFK